MKKKYEKPQIVIENFSLSTTIAGDCEFKTTTLTEGTCGYQTRGGVIFTQEVTGCTYKQPDTNDYLCYHVPNDNSNIFNS